MRSKLNSPAVIGLLSLLAASSWVRGIDKPAEPWAESPAGAPSAASSSGQNSELPAAEPIERYQAMIDRTPFALATQSAPVAPLADTAGFAKDLVLTGIVRLSQGEYISLASRDFSQRFGFATGESYNGISVVSVAWAEGIGKTKVTLKRGTEYGVVGFDEAVMRSPAADGQPPQPGGASQPMSPPIPGSSNVVPESASKPGAANPPANFSPRRRSIPLPPRF